MITLLCRRIWRADGLVDQRERQGVTKLSVRESDAYLIYTTFCFPYSKS